MEILRINGGTDIADPGEPSQRSSVQRSDNEHALSSPAALSSDDRRRHLSITEAEDISKCLLRYFAEPADVPADDPHNGTLGVPAVPLKSALSETDQAATRLGPKDVFHTHWMARAMSADSENGLGAARVVQTSKVHWIGMSLSCEGVHEASAAAAMNQWLKDSGGGTCTTLVSMPIDQALPPTATGKRTTMQPYASCTVTAAPPLPTFCAAANQYPGNSDFYPTVSASRDATERGAIADTTAELLRPLLRQWLDDNMGLMVEKALAAEAAENAQL